MHTTQQTSFALAVLAAAALVACGGGGSDVDGGTGGGTGGGAGGGQGQVTLAAITLTPGTAGSLTGSAEVPAGYTIDGTLAIACKRLGSECDTNGLISVNVVSTGTTTGTFELSGLAAGEWGVLLWKDVNNNQNFEVGDLYGAWTDSHGDLLWTQPGFQGSLVEMAVAPDDTPPTTNQDAGAPTVTPNLPAELVGTWTDVSSTIASGYTFNADGTFTHSAYFAMTLLSGCTRPTGYVEPYVFIYTQGNASAANGTITVEERSGIYQRDVDCQFSRTGAELHTSTGTYTLGTRSDGKRTLDVFWNGSSAANNYVEDSALPPNPAP